MSARADRSILKITFDQTRTGDTECIDDVLQRTLHKKKKRVSFSNSIGIKTIYSRLEQQRLAAEQAALEQAQNGKKENRECRQNPENITHQQKNPLKTFNQWSLNEQNRRLSGDSFEAVDNDQEFHGSLQPKLTGKRHTSFFIDPDDQSEIADFEAPEMTILNATAALPTTSTTSMLNQSVVPVDDFSRYLAEVDVEEVDMDISELTIGRDPEFGPRATSTANIVLPSPIAPCSDSSAAKGASLSINEDIGINSDQRSSNLTVKEDLRAIELQQSANQPVNVSSTSTIPPGAHTYIIERSATRQTEEIDSSNRAHTYTIVQDQSVDEARDAPFVLAGMEASWGEEPSGMSSVLDFKSTARSQNLSAVSTSSKIGNQSAVIFQAPLPPVACGEFHSPMRKGRRRTFVSVNRSQDREQRRMKLLGDRVSLESAVLASALNASTAASQQSHNASGLLEQKLTGKGKQSVSNNLKEVEEENIGSQPLSQVSQKPASTYKYTLPEMPSITNPSEIARNFLASETLAQMGSFNESLESVIRDFEASEQQNEAPLWEQVLAGENCPPIIPSPLRKLALQASLSVTPISADDTLASVSPYLTPKGTSAPHLPGSIEEKVQRLDTWMEQLSAQVDALEAINFRALPSDREPEDKPELLSRLSRGVKYRLKQAAAVWEFPYYSPVCSVIVNMKPVASGASSQFEAVVHLDTSPFCGPWLSKLSEISQEMIRSRLEIPHNVSQFSFGLLSQESHDALLVKVDNAALSTQYFVHEILKAAAKHLFNNPEENLRLSFEDDKPQVQVEMSTFPILAIGENDSTFYTKVTFLVKVDLSTYPSRNSIDVLDAYILGADYSSVATELFEQLNRNIRDMLNSPQPKTIADLVDLLCSVKTVN